MIYLSSELRVIIKKVGKSMTKKNISGVIIFYFLVPIILFIAPTFFNFFLAKKFIQIACDALIIVLTIALNYYFWNVHISVFTAKNFINQILQIIPAAIFLLLTTNFSNLELKILPVCTIIIVAIAEELVYRGMLLGLSMNLTKNRGFLSVCISSLGFSFAHIVNLEHLSVSFVVLQIIVVFISGVFWGTVYLNTGSLILPIIFHFLSDLPVFVGKSSSDIDIPSFSTSQLQDMYMPILLITLVVCVISYIQIRFFNPKNHNK